MGHTAVSDPGHGHFCILEAEAVYRQFVETNDHRQMALNNPAYKYAGSRQVGSIHRRSS
jgi:hypothetical protein